MMEILTLQCYLNYTFTLSSDEYVIEVCGAEVQNAPIVSGRTFHCLSVSSQINVLSWYTPDAF